MLVPVKRKCPKCEHEFVTWIGGFILKDPMIFTRQCPSCHHWRTKVIK